MGQRKVASREYKIMLRPARFRGNDRALLKAASTFWLDFGKSVASVVRSVDGELAEIRNRRLITFLDTASRHLNRNGYIFRERRDLTSGDREVTLKFRHPDRNVAQDRGPDHSHLKAARSKFEEDIKPPFVSLYSASTTRRIGAGRRLNELSDIARLFPDVIDGLVGLQHDVRLAAVNRFTARELVLCGASLRLGKGAKRAAECALIVWYDDRRRQHRPVAVEFSYRYGNKNEDYDGRMSLQAFQAFNVLQGGLRRWIDPRNRTKTAFVYG